MLARTRLASVLRPVSSLCSTSGAPRSPPTRGMALQVARTVAEMRAWRAKVWAPGATVGFVPTMGALHQGHVSLAQAARSCDQVAASIFVNPTQFAANEDLDKYPRTLEADLDKLEKAKVDIVFVPTAAEMYPVPPAPPFGTFVDPVGADALAEGVIRPGHFRGVATVVTKLFNIVQPTHAYFGQKDGLQCIVIRKIVRDLNIPVEISVQPTLREPDGLAMSSRNIYLSPPQRAVAGVIYQALLAGKGAYDRGVRDPRAVRKAVLDTLTGAQSPWIVPQYVSLADGFSGEDLDDNSPLGPRVMLAVAVKSGQTRLIDNVMLEAEDAKPK